MITLRLALYYAAIFTVLGTWLPYWPKWLQSRGCADQQIGWLMTIATVVRTVATPWLAARADASGHRRRALLLLSAAALLAFLPFPMVDGFWAFAGLSLLVGIAYPVLIPLCDNLTVLASKQVPGLHYGRVRLWGSLAFLVTAVLVGRAVEADGPAVVHTVILAALGAAILVVPLLPDFRDPDAVPATSTSRERPARDRPIRALLADRRFVTVIVLAGVLQSSHAAYYSFSTIYWTSRGIGEQTVGLLWAEGVVAEVLLFALFPRQAERAGTRRLFLIGAGAALLRWMILACSTDVSVIAATNWLHALSFGATHLAAIGYLQRHIPHHRSATAQSLLSALTTGVAMAAATALSGELYARIGGDVFWVMGGIALLGGALAWTLLDSGPRRRTDLRDSRRPETP